MNDAESLPAVSIHIGMTNAIFFSFMSHWKFRNMACSWVAHSRDKLFSGTFSQSTKRWATLAASAFILNLLAPVAPMTRLVPVLTEFIGGEQYELEKPAFTR